MNCSNARHHLSRYQDDELGVWRRLLLEHHLARCETCRSELAVDRQIWSLIGAEELARAPDVLGRLEAHLGREQRPTLVPRWRASLAYASLVVLFAVGGSAAGMYAAWPGHAGQSPDHSELAWFSEDIPPHLAALTTPESGR